MELEIRGLPQILQKKGTKEKLTEICERNDIVFMAVFGSFARGEQKKTSDIDIANVRLSFPSGCVANLTASRISLKKMRKLRLFQKDEYSSIDLDSREFVRCRLAPAGDNTPFNVNVEQKIIPAQDALEAELTAFVDAIRGGNPRAVTGQEALDVLEISDAILARL